MEWLVPFIILDILLLVGVLVWVGYRKRQIEEKIEAYKSINIGDSMQSVIEKLGSNYTESVLESGIVKCVWRLRNGGSNRVYIRGTNTSTSSYTPVQKITIKFRDNLVISKEGLNLDA